MMRGDDLYESVKKLEGDWLRGTVQKRITESISSSLIRAQASTDILDQSEERIAAGEKFLAVLKEAWEDHQLCMGMITDVLMYMVSVDDYGALGYNLTCSAGPHHFHGQVQALNLRRLNGSFPRPCPPSPGSP